MKPETFEIKVASREWSRQFYSSVGKSFAKTITEPVTNSDTSYKRKLSLPDNSGLIEKALSFEKGELFDLSQAKQELKSPSLERTIEIHLYTAKRHKQNPRCCEVVDHAEGMTPEELRQAFEFFAADKAAVSKGKPGRSLFGRGVSDVLLGHEMGTFYTSKEGKYSKLTLEFDKSGIGQPKGKLETINPTAIDLKDLHLKKIIMDLV